MYYQIWQQRQLDIAQTDHLRTMGLLEIAIDFADEVLADGGVFLAKAFRGGADKSLLGLLNERF